MIRLILPLFLCLLLFNACKKDNIITQKDICDGIICINGGSCINGICDCPRGYEGPACEDLTTPSKIRITKVVVNKFPATDNGIGWDPFSAADIYFTFGTTSQTLYTHPTYFKDVTPNSPLSFTPVNLEVTDVFSRHQFSLHDYDDFNDDDFMGGIEFTPFNGLDFPASWELSTGGDVSFTVSIEYIF